MDTTVGMQVKVTTPGMKEATAASLQLKKNFEGVQAAARIPVATQAAQMGVAKKSAAAPGGTASDTNLSRGVGGVTGAAGRDFAAQAQGLGGLVHVYATFAANLFAVSAAFTALSKAADLSNMVKGLDQIGATSGRSLGTLAKRLTEVTDNAISMKEAMSATALASAGGMSNTAILRMGMVARQAAAALGRDMPDAMERLSKGIVKTQPELLDELGIMTRVIPAQQEYARTIGKTITTLSEFEKKQAFANAVLKEGEEKFGAIALSANPYSKILASMSNLAFGGLEKLNTIIAPIINFLASSPTALGAAMLWITKILVSQAVPALGQWKKGLEEAAHAAAARSESIKDSFDTFKQGTYFKKADDLKNLGEQYRKTALEAIRTNELYGEKSSIFKKASMEDGGFSERNLRRVNTDLKSMNTQLSTLRAEGGVTAEGKVALANLEKQVSAQEGLYNTIVKQREAYKGKNREEINGIHEVEKEAKNYWSQYSQRARIAEADAKKAASLGVLSQVGKDLPEKGLGGTLTSLYKNSREGIPALKAVHDEFGNIVQAATNGIPPLTGFNKIFTNIKGTVIASASALMTLASSLSNVFLVVGIGVAVFQLFDNWLSTDTKSSETLAKSLVNLEDAFNNISNVIKDLEKRDPFYLISTKALGAKATAVQGVAEAISKVVDDTREQVVASQGGLWSNTFEWWKEAFGISQSDKAAKFINESISRTFTLVASGSARDKAAEALSSLLNTKVDPSNLKNLQSIITGETVAKFGPQIGKILAELTNGLGTAADKAKTFDDTLVTAGKAYDNLVNAHIPTDNVAKLGIEITSVGTAMAKALKDPVTAIAELGTAIDNVATLRFLSPEYQNDLKNNYKDIKNNTHAYAEYNAIIEKTKLDVIRLSEELKKSKEEDEKIKKNPQGFGDLAQSGKTSAIQKQLDLAQKHLQIAQTGESEVQKKLTPALETFSKEAYLAIAKGADLIHSSISLGFEKAAITLQQAYAAGISGTAGGILEQAELTKRSIDIQIKQVSASLGLIESQDRLNNSIALLRHTEEEARIDRMADTPEKITAKKAWDKEEEVLKAYTTVQGKTVTELAGILKGSISLSTKLPSTLAEREAASRAMGTAQQKEGVKAKLSELGASRSAADIDAEYKLMDHTVTIQKDIISLSTSILNINKAKLDIESKYALYQTEEMLAAERANSEAIIANTNAGIALDWQNKINKATIAWINTKDGSVDEDNAYLARQELMAGAVRQAQKDKDNAAIREIANQDKIRQAVLARFNTEQALAKTLQDTQNTKTQTVIALKEEELTRATTLGGMHARELADMTTSIAMDKEKEASAQRLFTINQAADKAAKESEVKLSGVTAGSQAAKDIEVQRDANKEFYSAQVAGEEAVSAAKQKNIELSGIFNALAAEQTEQMTKMVSVTESLTTAFGDVGTAIGKVGEAIQKMSDKEVNTIQAKLSLTEKLTKAEEETAALKSDTTDTVNRKQLSASLAKEAELKKGIARLDAKRMTDELDGISSIAGESKKMFAEKTIAYKLFSGVEKATAAVSMALKVQDMATDIASLPAKGTKAILSALSAPFPVNFIAGAAMAAIVASLIGGGSVPSIPAGFTAEDQQKVQGTGQSYDANGNIIANGAGALGDATKVSDTIVKSIEALGTINYAMLEFNKNKVYEALLAIKDNTYKFVKSIALTTGLTSAADPFGIVQSSSSGTFSSNETKIVNEGIRVIGTLGDLAAGLGERNMFANVHTEGSTWFSSSSSNTPYLQKIDDASSKFITGMFNSVMDALVESSTVFNKDKQAVAEQLRSFQITLDISSLNRTGEEFASAILAGLGIEIDKAAATVYPELKALQTEFQKLGESTGDFLFRMVDDTRNIDLAFKSMNKIFEGVQAVPRSITQGPIAGLSKGEISLILDEAAGGLDKFLTNIDNFTGKFLTEEERLIPIRAAVTEQFSALNITMPTTRDGFKDLIQGFQFTDAASVQTFNSLLSLSDAFDLLNKSTDKILNAEELALAKRAQLIELTAAQGYAYDAMIMSREDKYTELLAQDPTGDLKRGQKKIDAQLDLNKTESLNIELLNAQGKAGDVLLITRANELKALSDTDKVIKQLVYDTLDANKLLEARTAQQIKIYGLLSNSAAALLITRTKELSLMDEVLRPVQEYIYRLEDEIALKAELKTAYNAETTAIKSTISTLKSSIKTLSEYRASLVVGSLSVLTPAQKYEEAKSQMQAIAKAAMSTDTSTAGLAARDDALGKLTGATDTFLGLSRELFASSTQYQTDFMSVLSILDNTSTVLTSQELFQESSLTALETNNTILDIIKDNTRATADILRDYLIAVGATAAAAATAGVSSLGTIPTFASGGLAQGLSLVGEKGPELINFSSPTRVFSNQASNDLLNNKELVAEIRNLRAEVAQLRSDQHEQTGHLIASNFEANAKAANTIADATEQAAATTAWKDRSRVKVA